MQNITFFDFLKVKVKKKYMADEEISSHYQFISIYIRISSNKLMTN